MVWGFTTLPLQLTFPIVYGIATTREASVASSLERLGIEERRSWNAHLIWEPNDWEMSVMDEFLCTLGSNLPSTEELRPYEMEVDKEWGF